MLTKRGSRELASRMKVMYTKIRLLLSSEDNEGHSTVELVLLVAPDSALTDRSQGDVVGQVSPFLRRVRPAEFPTIGGHLKKRNATYAKVKSVDLSLS